MTHLRVSIFLQVIINYFIIVSDTFKEKFAVKFYFNLSKLKIQLILNFK